MSGRVSSNYSLQTLRIDVDDIKYVINVDFPNRSEDYIHRIGRTARSNNKGTAYTFFTFSNMKQAKDLVAVLKEANQTINPKLMELYEMSKSFGNRGGRGGLWKSSYGGSSSYKGYGKNRYQSQGRYGNSDYEGNQDASESNSSDSKFGESTRFTAYSAPRTEAVTARTSLSKSSPKSVVTGPAANANRSNFNSSNSNYMQLNRAMAQFSSQKPSKFPPNSTSYGPNSNA